MNASLKSNLSVFTVDESFSPSLTLATAVSTSTSTSHFNSCLEEASGLLSLLAFGGVSVTLGDFYQAGAHPDNAGAERLVFGDNGRIVRSEQANFKFTGNEDEEITTDLQRNLEQEYPSLDAVALINKHLPERSGDLFTWRKLRPSLSTATLNNILSEAAANATNARKIEAVQAAQASSVGTSKALMKDPFENGIYRNGFSIIKSILPESLRSILPKTFKERAADINLARQRYSKIENLISSVVNNGRGESVFNASSNEIESLYIQAQKPSDDHQLILQKIQKKAKIVAWLHGLLEQEVQRLTALQRKTSAELLLEQSKKALQTASNIAGNPSISGDELKTELDQLSDDDSSSLLDSLDGIITLPDVSVNGALGACYSILKIIIQKNNEVRKDAIEDQLARVNAELAEATQSANDFFQEALRFSQEAHDADEAAQREDASRVLAFANAIKSPLGNNDAEWNVWSQQLTKLGNMSDDEQQEWNPRIAALGTSGHLSTLVSSGMKKPLFELRPALPLIVRLGRQHGLRFVLTS